MVRGISVEVLLAASYAAFLVLVAAGLEALARNSHRRAEQFQLAGFRYRPELDLWDCPAGHQLTRSETDHQRRIVRYRAPSPICNRCPAKPSCTDSSEGRQIEQHLESWFSSEIRRFHRGLSLALLLLAASLLAVETVRHHRRSELITLSGLLAPISVMAVKRFSRS